MRTQVRIYRALEGRVADFAAEWAEQVVPLRRRFGFTILAAWASEDDDTFVWVVGHEGDDWEAAERAYYESDERRSFDPDPVRLLAEHRAVFARPVPLP